MKKQVLINVEDKDIRVAVLEDGQLTQLFIEQLEEKSIVGNIYKGRVESIVPGLKAVFVDIGLEKNAFLHFSDVRPEYLLPDKGAPKRAPRKEAHPEAVESETETNSHSLTVVPVSDHTRPRAAVAKPRSIELRLGDEVLVQVSKESISVKGARVTTHISLPGRFLVFLPFSEKEGGVSRRIEAGAERGRLKTLLKTLKAEEGGFIIRTAGLNQEEDEISSDVKKLKKLWQKIRRNATAGKAPVLVHDDHEIISRIVRDELTEDTEEIIIDSKTYAKNLRVALTNMVPTLKKRVVLYDNPYENLFDVHGVEAQFQKALRRKVWLKSGGYIVIDEAEALVAIDVNTGKFVGREDQESTILKTNLEAAEVVARQLQLRDVGGIIVIDFIDMRTRENQQKLLNRFKDLIKHDRAKTTVIPLTEYGLLQMTRKRVRQSLSRVIFKECPYCQASGRILNESQIWKNIKYEIYRMLKEDPTIKAVQISVHPDMRLYLEQEMLSSARLIANRHRVALSFIDNRDFHLEQYSIVKQEVSEVRARLAGSRKPPQKKAEKKLENPTEKEG